MSRRNHLRREHKSHADLRAQAKAKEKEIDDREIRQMRESLNRQENVSQLLIEGVQEERKG